MKMLVCTLLISAASTVLAQGLPLPERIGGRVIFQNQVIDQSTDSGLVFRVTRPDQSALVPDAIDDDGLNQQGFFVLDIPQFDPQNQPMGARAGDDLVSRVFYNGVEMTVTSPTSGQFTAGEGGSVQRVDLTVKAIPLSVSQVMDQWPNLGILDLVTTLSDAYGGS